MFVCFLIEKSELSGYYVCSLFANDKGRIVCISGNILGRN